ncbi:MAG: ribbon-helix-helix domain-containing protein [Spirosomaceae bacterium]|jgi:hypothetical protein|nr:ribbon-helix-helix domain-containing protein [Spirosomataceae bacterium]
MNPPNHFLSALPKGTDREKGKQDILLNVRIDEETDEKLRELAEKSTLKVSEFIRRIIWNFEQYADQQENITVLQRSLILVKNRHEIARKKVAKYEDAPDINALFKRFEGSKVGDKIIKTKADLIAEIVKAAAIEAESVPEATEIPKTEFKAIKIVEEKVKNLTKPQMQVFIGVGVFMLLSLFALMIRKVSSRRQQPTEFQPIYPPYFLTNPEIVRQMGKMPNGHNTYYAEES